MKKLLLICLLVTASGLQAYGAPVQHGKTGDAALEAAVPGASAVPAGEVFL